MATETIMAASETGPGAGQATAQLTSSQGGPTSAGEVRAEDLPGGR